MSYFANGREISDDEFATLAAMVRDKDKSEKAALTKKHRQENVEKAQKARKANEELRTALVASVKERCAKAVLDLEVSRPLGGELGGGSSPILHVIGRVQVGVETQKRDDGGTEVVGFRVTQPMLLATIDTSRTPPQETWYVGLDKESRADLASDSDDIIPLAK